MILVCGGIKGGSGKTTIATNLAAMRAKAGKDVLSESVFCLDGLELVRQTDGHAVFVRIGYARANEPGIELC